METILTPKQAKKAREEVGLSQGNVAASLGINRTYLSLFESGKYLFDDDTLERMQELYMEHGADIELPDAISDDGTPFGHIRVMDGFVIAQLIPDETVEDLLSEYAENNKKIDDLLKAEPKKNDYIFFQSIDEEDMETRKRLTITLMARNYSIVEELHGRSLISQNNDDILTEENSISVHIKELFSKSASILI